jgi:Flp pilus assembly protein TadG
MMQRKSSMVRRRGLAARRRGTATVELAVCVPLIVSLVFGAIEVANVIFLKQALSVASYEAAQRASARGGDETNAQEAAESVLAAHGVSNGTIDIEPAVTIETEAGTEIVVTATAPLSGNTFLFQMFRDDDALTTTTTMLRL